MSTTLRPAKAGTPNWLANVAAIFFAATLGAMAAAPVVLVNDNFNANTVNTFDLNVDIARQTGTLAPIQYSLAGGPGHYGHQLQNANAQNQLLLADFPNSTSSLNQNFNNLLSAGGLVISFDVDSVPTVYGGSPDNWGCINLGMAQADQMVNVNGGAAHFGILFRANGRLQAFDGGGVVSPNPEPVYSTKPPGSTNHIDLVITDTDGNPFDGVGNTIIEVFANGGALPVWTYTKAGGYANNYINLQGSFRAHFDNLIITQLPSDRTPTIVNRSFEADNFTVFPGYVSGNGPITGWSSLGNHGVNPGTFGGPFTDNGTIPDGSKAAFLQGDGPMSQVVSGFTIGAQYQIRYSENARNCCSGTAPFVEVKVGGQTIVAAHAVPPVGGANPYHLRTSDPFTATSTSMELSFIKSNPQGGDTTLLLDNIIVLLPNTPPSIARHPESQIIGIGETVTFTVVASGSAPLSYQWFHNNNAIAGATDAVYSFLVEFPDQGGDYHVVVSNSAGTVESSKGTLTVRASVPGLFNTGVDDNKQALPDNTMDPHYTLVVNADSASTDAIVQDSTMFPIVAGPWVANNAAGKWIGPRFNTAEAAGLAQGNGVYVYRTSFDLTGLDLASVVITGGWAIDNNGLSIRVNGTPTGLVNNNGFGGLTSFTISSANATFVDGLNTLEFEVQNVDATVGYTGLRVANLRGLAALSGTPPSITAHPQSQTAGTGEALSLSVTASGSSPLAYQWYQNGSALGGATSSILSIASASHADAGNYFVVVSNPAGRATSEVAVVTVRDTVPGLFNTGVDDSKVVLADAAVDGHYKLIVNADGASSDAIVHSSTVFPIVAGPWVANSASSKWIGPRVDTAGAAGGNYVYRLAFNMDGIDPTSVEITGLWATDNEGSDILLNGVSTGNRNTAQFASYTPFRIASGFLAGQNTLDFQVNNASVGWTALRVDSIRALGTALPDGTAPFIVQEPQDITAPVRDTVTFSVRANGTGPLQYQWFFGSDPLPGQTGPTLTLFLEFPDFAGPYSVEITNPFGTVRSREATLTILTAPTIVRQPQSQVAAAGDTVSFSVEVRGSEPFEYQWTFNGGDIPGATDSVLTLANVTAANGGNYAVRVSNSEGTATSATATLRIGEALRLFNTGVDDSGAALADGATDPHYSIIVNPDSASQIPIVEDSTVFPIVSGPWVANNDRSKWIGPRFETSGAAGGAGAAGDYMYRTTLDLTGYDHTSAHVSGMWATDNEGIDIFINGVSTGQGNPNQFTVLTRFVISSGFQPGVNTIDFKLNNSAVGYTGLRIDQVRAIGVPRPNTCPVASNQGISVNEGSQASFQLEAMDSDGDALQYQVTQQPAHGTLAVEAATGATTYIPAPGYCGPDSFRWRVSDGQCNSAEATASIEVFCLNHPPTAVATVAPLVELVPGVSNLVISPNGSNAVVLVDGSLSSDPDGDPLSFAWFIDGTAEPFATTAQAAVELEIGAHRIILAVTDGRGGSDTDAVEVEVISASMAVDFIAALVDDSDIGRKNKRPFIASLKSAAAAFDRGSTQAGLNILHAFQNKTRAQIGRTNPDLAEQWIMAAQMVIDALTPQP